MAKKKFKQGKAITRIDELMEILIINKEWVYYKDKPKHPEFILHMQLKTVIQGLTNRCFKEAIKLEEETSNKRWIKKMSEELFNYYKEPEDKNLRCCKCRRILKMQDNKYIVCSLEQKNLVSKFLCEKCYKKDKGE